MFVRYRIELNVSRVWGTPGWVSVGETSSIRSVENRIEQYMSKGFRRNEIAITKVVLG